MSAKSTPQARSVFLDALGPAAAGLHPEVLKYVTGPGKLGAAVLVDGEFDVAGSRFGKLNLLAVPLVGRELFVTKHERRVPFHVVNRLAIDEGGAVGLQAIREFSFRGGPQRFVDVLLPGAHPGTLRNLLGRARRVELELHCSVSERGFLRLTSGRAWLRLGGLRVPLPTLLSVRAELEDGFEESSGRNTVRARVQSPILGTVLEYLGSFRARPE